MLLSWSEWMLVLCAFFWGGTFVLIKDSLIHTDPVLFLLLRFSLASLAFLPFAIKFKEKSKEGITASLSAKRKFLFGFLLSLVFFLAYVTQTLGLETTQATKSGFITGTFVVFTPFLQGLIERKIPKSKNILGVLVVFAGLFFLSAPAEGGFQNLSHWRLEQGDAITLASAFFFALHIVLIDAFRAQENTIFYTIMQLSGVAFFSFLFLVMRNGPLLESNLWNSQILWISVFYTGIFATVITTFLQTKYQPSVSPTKAGIIFSLEPVFSAIFAFVYLSEVLSLVAWIGCLLLFLGLVISEIRFGKSD